MKIYLKLSFCSRVVYPSGGAVPVPDGWRQMGVHLEPGSAKVLSYLPSWALLKWIFLLLGEAIVECGN